MIGIIIHGLTNLKVLCPIIKELHELKKKYIVFIPQSPKGMDVYRATSENINESSPHVLKNSVKCEQYADENDLIAKIIKDGIKKVVGVGIVFGEAGIEKLKHKNIERFSILYWTDTLKSQDKREITTNTRIYYPTKYIKDSIIKDFGIKEDKERDKLIGYPPLDPLFCLNATENRTLLLPANFKTIVEVKYAFKDSAGKDIDNPMERVSKKISESSELIIKMRYGNKLVYPKKIRNYCIEHIMETMQQYPSTIVDALSKTCCAVGFNSNSIFESIVASNYYINIPINLLHEKFGKDKMREFYNTKMGGAYNFPGVCESVKIEDFLKKDNKFKIKRIDKKQKEKWTEQFLGDIDNYGSKKIASDISEF